MQVKSVQELLGSLSEAVQVEEGKVSVIDESLLRDKIDGVVHVAVFGEGLVRDTARWLIREIGKALNIYLASIHELYIAIGRGDVPSNFTVPAINVRAMNFNTSRAIFRAANKLDVGSMLFEIARSEMGYTDQRPADRECAGGDDGRRHAAGDYADGVGPGERLADVCDRHSAGQRYALWHGAERDVHAGCELQRFGQFHLHGQ